MNRKKLTLSVEERLTRRAKAIAERRGTSVSPLVETLFSALEQEGEDMAEVEQARRRGTDESPKSTGDPLLAGYEPSDYGGGAEPSQKKERPIPTARRGKRRC